MLTAADTAAPQTPPWTNADMLQSQHNLGALWRLSKRLDRLGARLAQSFSNLATSMPAPSSQPQRPPLIAAPTPSRPLPRQHSLSSPSGPSGPSTPNASHPIHSPPPPHLHSLAPATASNAFIAGDSSVPRQNTPLRAESLLSRSPSPSSTPSTITPSSSTATLTTMAIVPAPLSSASSITILGSRTTVADQEQSSSSLASISSAATTSTAAKETTEASSSPMPERPSMEPQSPIGLHHALDGSIPYSATVNAGPNPLRKLPRSIETSVKDTLAKEPSPQSGYPATVGQRRIMTPTSRLAETAVGVREVSKKIGRARVKWDTPKTVMVVTKPGDDSLLKITREIALWMIASRGLTVYVDEKLKDIPKFRYPSFLKSSKLQYDYTPSLKFWTSTLCAQEAHLIDFVVTLGGDGTVLFTSWLFQSIVPPILPFSAGSLGFLTPFPTADYQQTLSTCLDHGVRVNLRMRFSCTIYRCLEHRAAEKSNRKKKKKEDEKGQRRKGARSGRRRRGDHNNNEDEDDEEDDSDEEGAKRALPTVLTTPTETFEILNDLVLDRGPSANLSLLELFGDEQHLTTVQADGIVISTPTGSTAYSLAAGGPLTHPEIPAILISPICPHTLSFRPMLLPDSMELRICVPFDSRSTAWASFDGRGRVELKQGDHIKVTASVYPFPTICSSTQSSDWFHSLSRCLRWNERERQKGFRVVEHGRSKRTRQPSSTSLLSPPGNNKSSPSNIPNENGSLSSIPRAPHAGPGVGSTGSIESLHMESLPSQPQQRLHHGHAHTASSGSSVGSLRVRQSSLRPQHDSSSQRRAGKSTGDYYDQSSPHDTDTMLTCWGTDSSPSSSDEDDDSNSDSDDSGSNSDADSSDGDSDQNCEKIAKKEEAAEDGDGEWEEETSSEDDDDDYDDDMRDPSSVSMSGGELELTGPSEFQGQSLGVWVETEPARTSGRQGSSDSLSRQQQSLLQRPQKLQQKLEQGIMQLDLQQTPSQPPLPEQPIGKAVARPEDPKLTEQNGLQYQRDSDTSGACSSSSSSNGGTSSSRTVGVNECLVGVQNGSYRK